MSGKNMNDFRKQLAYSLAVEGSDVVINDEPTVEITEDPLDESETISAQSIESIGDQAEVADLESEAEELLTVDQMGEELVQAVESAIASKKGLSPVEGVALRLTMKQIVGKYSMGPVLSLPAREEYGGTADAYKTTVLACESLKEDFNTFWEVARKQFLKMMEQLQGVFRNIVQYFTGITKRAQQLYKRAKEMQGNASGGLVSGVASVLANKDSSFASGVINGMATVVNLTAAVKAVSKEDNVSQASKGVESLDDVNEWKDYVAAENVRSGHVTRALGEKPLLGGRKLVLHEGQEGSRDQFSYEELVTEENKTSTDSVDAATPDEVVKIAEIVLMINDEVSKYAKAWERGLSKASRIVQGVNTAYKASGKNKEDDAEQSEDDRTPQFKVNVSALLAHIRRKDKFISDISSYGLEVCKAALDFGEKSLDAEATGETPQGSQLPATTP